MINQPNHDMNFNYDSHWSPCSWDNTEFGAMAEH